jgi:hypothetical protein
MTGRLFMTWMRSLSVVMLTLAIGLPAANAEVLIFRNDTKSPLVVQAACLVNGKVRRDQPMLVQPGGLTRVALPGNKQITVFDARPPNTTLFQGTLPASLEDQLYSMQADPTAPVVRMLPIKGPGVP